jgi:parallel beta-helix repeat protein
MFRIMPGRHVHVAVIPKSGNQFIGDPGAIMDGQNNMDFAFSGGAANVVLDNLEITGYLGGSAHIGAIQGYDATGWVLNNLNVHDNAYLGANLRGSFTVTGGSYHHNGQYGLAVTQALNSVIDGAELSYNNLAGVADPLRDAGGIKVSNSNGMTIRNVNSHHNNGPGIWYDINNQSSVLENNTVHDNNYAGIFYEISYSGIIRGNTVSHNGTADSNYTGAGILVSASPDVQVVGNTVVASTSHGIIALQEDRGSGIFGLYQTRNLSVHDNTVTLPSGKRSGMLDFISSSDKSAMLSDRNNIFNNNNYTIAGNTLPFYPGNLNAVSQTGWQAFGQDVGSTFAGP